jgi:hypothetical protein
MSGRSRMRTPSARATALPNAPAVGPSGALKSFSVAPGPRRPRNARAAAEAGAPHPKNVAQDVEKRGVAVTLDCPRRSVHVSEQASISSPGLMRRARGGKRSPLKASRNKARARETGAPWSCTPSGPIGEPRRCTLQRAFPKPIATARFANERERRSGEP